MSSLSPDLTPRRKFYDLGSIQGLSKVLRLRGIQSEDPVAYGGTTLTDVLCQTITRLHVTGEI